MCKEFCNVEPDHCVCNDTSRDQRLYWRTEDVKDVEKEEEQHGKQGKVEDVVGERCQNHPNQEKPEKWWIQGSHFWQSRTARFLSALAASLRGSQISSLIKWVLIFGGR